MNVLPKLTPLPRCTLSLMVVWLLALPSPASAADPPLSVEQIRALIAANVGRAEIMAIVESRGLDFVVTPAAADELVNLGARRELTGLLAEWAVPLMPDVKAAAAEVDAERFAQATRALNAILEKSPAHRRARLLRVIALQQLENHEQATNELTSLISDYPNNTRYQLMRANSLKSLGRMQEAIDDLTAAIQAEPFDFFDEEEPLGRQGTFWLEWRYRSFGARSEVYEELRQYWEAVADLRSAIALAPDKPEGYFMLARLLSLMPEADERSAGEAADLALLSQALSPAATKQEGFSLYAMALAQAALGHFDVAKERLMQATVLLNADQDLSADLAQDREAINQAKPRRLPPGTDSSRSSSRVLSDLLESMVKVPGASFQMGSDKHPGEGPRHAVSLSEYWIQPAELTNRQWSAVVRRPTSDEPDLPVTGKSWRESMQFAEALNELLESPGLFRLPTEAEWEYASRAGGEGVYFFGDDSSDLDRFAAYGSNSDGKLAPVRSKEPNPWGLYDIYGNVAEWCLDAYDDYPEGARTNPGRSPQEGPLRIYRGGSYLNSADQCRSTFRGLAPEKDRHRGLGLRLVADDGATLQQVLQRQAAKEESFGLDRVIEELMADVRRGIHKQRSPLTLIKYYRAHVCYENGDYSSAMDLLGEVAESAGESPLGIAAICYQAWIQLQPDYKNRNVKYALETALAARRLANDAHLKWLPLLLQAACESDAKDYDEAVRFAQRAMDAAPNDNLAKELGREDPVSICRSVLQGCQARTYRAEQAFPYPLRALPQP